MFTKIIPTEKYAVNYLIINHLHNIVSPITNDFNNINVTGKDENKSVSKLLFRISVREIYSDMVRPMSKFGLP